MSSSLSVKAITVPWIRNQKGKQKLTMLTAYDYPTAALLDETGVEILLVGDSLATVVYGEPNTLSVTMEDMLRHAKAVTRAAKRALVVGDMPFMSYQVSQEKALENAGRFLKEAQAQAVKLEGGLEYAETVRALARAGVPVMAHIGLTPQSIHALGTYRMHGKNLHEQNYLKESALALSEAGAFAIVLECIEPSLAAEITNAASVPTIGIGSGNACDGQVLVIHDLVGLTLGHVPRFVNPVAELREDLKDAARQFISRTKADLNTGESKHAPSH
ncbi:MAG: 3-methyl-2-oxobutanoate hydroxymethyltransferase [Bdellovibrionota bacterium]